MFRDDRRQASGVDDEEYRYKNGPLWHRIRWRQWVWNICHHNGHAVSDQLGNTGTMQEQSSLHLVYVCMYVMYGTRKWNEFWSSWCSRRVSMMPNFCRASAWRQRDIDIGFLYVMSACLSLCPSEFGSLLRRNGCPYYQTLSPPGRASSFWAKWRYKILTRPSTAALNTGGRANLRFSTKIAVYPRKGTV